MTNIDVTSLEEFQLLAGDNKSASAVSWSAIIAGATVAVAASLALLLMGSGLGLTMISPWASRGVGPTTFAVSTVIWLIVVQWLSSALGGFLTGRLTTRWTDVQPDEVFFRDTAHGLLTWALATVLVASVLGSAVSTVITGSAGVAKSIAAGSGQGINDTATSGTGWPTDYFVDLMFRRPATPPSTTTAAAASPNGDDPRREASRILIVDIASGSVSPADRSYLAQLVSAWTGRPAADAQQRVNEVITQIDQATAKARDTANVARKAAITISLMVALSLIIGAFVASVAAAYGGQVRDEV